MRFMMLLKATQDSEAGGLGNPELAAATAKMAEEASRRGQLIDAGGLMPSSAGARIQVANGKTSMIDGPFAETKELVGGFAIFELGSKEEAVQMATEFMRVHADILGPAYEGVLEVRPMFGTPPNVPKRN
jgi:hypothetical protein